MKFSPDVEQILREHGREPVLGELPDTEGWRKYLARPTRQQIIEEAVRRWKAEIDAATGAFIDSASDRLHVVSSSALLRGDG